MLVYVKYVPYWPGLATAIRWVHSLQGSRVKSKMAASPQVCCAWSQWSKGKRIEAGFALRRFVFCCFTAKCWHFFTSFSSFEDQDSLDIINSSIQPPAVTRFLISLHEQTNGEWMHWIPSESCVNLCMNVCNWNIEILGKWQNYQVLYCLAH